MSRPNGGDEAIRSFMHQLGMMEGMFGGASGRDSFSKIAEKLQPSIPAHEKIDALNELSQAFLMGTELTLRGFDAATFASLIVPCLDVAGGNAVPVMRHSSFSARPLSQEFTFTEFVRTFITCNFKVLGLKLDFKKRGVDTALHASASRLPISPSDMAQRRYLQGPRRLGALGCTQRSV